MNTKVTKTTTETPSGAGTVTTTSPYVVQPNFSVRSGRRSYVGGETVNLSERDGARLETQGRVKRADNIGRQGAIANSEQRDADQAKGEAAELVAGTVAEVEESIATMDETGLKALEKAEKKGKARQGVADAIERRRAQLAADAEAAAGEGAE